MDDTLNQDPHSKISANISVIICACHVHISSLHATAGFDSQTESRVFAHFFSNVWPAVLMPQRARLVRCVADQIMGFFFFFATSRRTLAALRYLEMDLIKMQEYVTYPKYLYVFFLKFWKQKARECPDSFFQKFCLRPSTSKSSPSHNCRHWEPEKIVVLSVRYLESTRLVTLIYFSQVLC